MLKANDDVTASVRNSPWIQKHARKLAIGITAIAFLASVWGLNIATTDNRLRLKGQSFSVEYMTTKELRQQGLSGRTSLPDDHVALFVLDTTGQACFWMKDMRFSIDMVWFNDAKEIVAIERAVSPSSYPDQYCHKGKYVAEFTAGTATRLNLKTGDEFHL